MLLTLEVIDVNAEIFQWEKIMFYNCLQAESICMLIDCFTSCI